MQWRPRFCTGLSDPDNSARPLVTIAIQHRSVNPSIITGMHTKLIMHNVDHMTQSPGEPPRRLNVNQTVHNTTRVFRTATDKKKNMVAYRGLRYTLLTGTTTKTTWWHAGASVIPFSHLGTTTIRQHGGI